MKTLFRAARSLLTMPLKELPAQDLKEYGRFVLSQVDRAARLDNPDWQVLLKLKAEGIELLLPEVQQIRGLARALQVRFRAEIAQGRFDDAIRTAKTMFACRAIWASTRHSSATWWGWRSLRWPSTSWTKCSSSRAARSLLGADDLAASP